MRIPQTLQEPRIPRGFLFDYFVPNKLFILLSVNSPEISNHQSETSELSVVKDEYFKAYIEGNARFPTYAFPFVVLVAHAAISDPRLDLLAFARSRLNEEQLTELKRKVAHQHAQRTIPVAPAGYEDMVRDAIAAKHNRAANEVEIKTLPDDYFQFVWRSYVNHAIAMIGALAGIRSDPKKWIFYNPFVYNHRLDKVVEDKKLIPLATEVAARLKDEHVRMDVQDIFRSFANTLHGPHGRKKSDEIRAVQDYSERGLPADDQRLWQDERKIRELNQKLFDAMIGEYFDLNKGGGIARDPRILSEKEIAAFKSTFVHP